MTPYELEETKRMAIAAVAKDGTAQMQLEVFRMLCALLQHESDKEAERNVEPHRRQP